jgi:hypothetical protein
LSYDGGHSFIRYLANVSVIACPHVSLFHYRAPNLHDEKYMTSSLRFKEAAFARHFCTAFPSLNALYAPFWSYVEIISVLRDYISEIISPRSMHSTPPSGRTPRSRSP